MDQENQFNEQTQKTADAGRASVEEAANAVRLATDHATKVTEHISQTAADVSKHSAGIAKASFAKGADAASHGFERAREQFTSALGYVGPEAEKLAERSRNNIEAVSEATRALIKGAEDLSQAWMSFATDGFARNIDSMNRFTQARSLQDLAATQGDFVRQSLGRALDGGRRMAEIYMRVSDEAAGHIRT